MRIRTLATGVCVIFVPSLLIYYIYYDSISDRTAVAPSSHKYSPVWQHHIKIDPNNVTAYRESVRSLFRVPSLPSGNESRDSNPEIEERRQFVKVMMKDAWKNYVRFAWGYNELKPQTREPKKDSIFGAAKIGATLIDAMDTLLIMGMHDEFAQAREWVRRDFRFNETENEVSVFETIIRYLGGLLSCYAMTGDELFLDKAREVAESLLPAYTTETGLPYGLVIPKTRKAYHHTWAFGSILSEMGSQHLEYVYLSDMSGDHRFRQHAFQIRNIIDRAEKPNGLYMTMMDSSIGRWNENKSSLGALGDSFYEYLIKAYIQSGHTDRQALRMYLAAMDAVQSAGMINISRTGLYYIADWVFGKPNNKMQHLTCFAPGMFALGASHMAQDFSTRIANDSDNGNSNNNAANNNKNELINAMDSRNATIRELIARHMAIAVNVTETCYQSYNRTPTKIGPESFYFDENDDATNRNGDMYILRPEVIESYFVMWRATHDPRYREYAWQAAQAIYRHCRTPHGYAGLYNVMSLPPTKDNAQQSFFLAETLKYLYLIFSNDQLIPLDEWVFNTEAHPLPICGSNAAYPIPLCGGRTDDIENAKVVVGSPISNH